MTRVPRLSRRQMALRLQQESLPALPPATHEAAVAALADLLLEALEATRSEVETAEGGHDELED
jgi:hypothetical protein